MDLFDLRRPDHIEDPAWAAVELARSRLRGAWEGNDLPEVLGKAKELVETVARVVVGATGETAGDAADFTATVKRAQKSLARQPGVDLSRDQNLRAISQAAQTLATGIGPIRNSHGTGHGRDRVPDVVDEMATMTMEAALLWSRWALRRVGHVLADYPNDLIAAVGTGTSRNVLREKFEAAALAQQPAEVQLRIGVAFGQQAAGGFGNATEVGVEPALDGGYDEYPIDYRLGLLKGMLLTAGGHIGLTGSYAPRFVSLLTSLPEARAQVLLEQARGDVSDATWLDSWRGSTEVEPDAVVASLRQERERVPDGYRELFGSFCCELESAGRRSRPEEVAPS